MNKRMKHRKNTNKIKKPRPGKKTIVICSLTNCIRRNVDEILYLEANGINTIVYLSTTEFILSTKNIGYWEKMLPDTFWRIHHHWLINSEKIKNFIYRQYTVQVQDKLINVARRRLSKFLALYKKSGIR